MNALQVVVAHRMAASGGRREFVRHQRRRDAAATEGGGCMGRCDAVDNNGLSDGYHGIAGGVHYLLHRNVRVMTEAGVDLKRERTRLTLGATLAF